MVHITAGMVKDLREKSGAGMMDCKKALIAVNADIEEAIDWLRKEGLSSAAKKAGRVASEGLVGVSIAGATGAILEINTETDFVSRNEQFQDFVETAVHMMAKESLDLDGLKAFPYGNGRTVFEELTHLMSVIGENMEMRRGETLTVENGVVAQYVHSAIKPGIGRIGVLVALSSAGNNSSQLEFLGKKIAMHVAAARPQAVDIEQMDSDIVERERSIFAAQARVSDKPEQVIGKMIEGRIRKFYEENALLEQAFIMDTDKKIKDIVDASALEVGAPITVDSFCFFSLGECAKRKEENFSETVSALTG